MKLNREIHNFREWQQNGTPNQEIIIDLDPNEIDIHAIYDQRHLCFVPCELDIPTNKQAVRIPITVPLTDGVFTLSKITRIRRKYVLVHGDTFATMDLLTPFLSAEQLYEIDRCLTVATEQYLEQLPESEVV